MQFEKLEIHGRLALITHAVHHQIPVNGAPSVYQMIEYVPSLSIVYYINFFNIFFCDFKIVTFE